VRVLPAGAAPLVAPTASPTAPPIAPAPSASHLPLVLALLGAMSAAPSRARTDAQPTAEERTALHAATELLASLDARWDDRRADALGELFAADAELQVQGEPTLRGRGEIRRSYETRFASLPDALRQQTRLDAARTLAPGVVFLAGQVAVADPASPADEAWHSWLTAVAVRCDGAWRLQVFRVVPQQ
jgi:uncharacterized protein (TIGR02246 family)